MVEHLRWRSSIISSSGVRKLKIDRLLGVASAVMRLY